MGKQTPAKGLTAAGLRIWGYLFLLLGIVARGVIQNGMLNLQNVNSQQLLETLRSSGSAMTLATVSLIMQALEACAVPIFAFLLVEGFCHRAKPAKFLGKVTLVALISEIPYHLAMSGKLFSPGTRNPALGLVLAAAMLWLLRTYGGTTTKSLFVTVLIILGAILWCGMLGVEHGVFTVMLVAAAWFVRGKSMQTLIFAGVAALGVALSALYLLAPISALALYFYNEKKGESNRRVNILCYPVMLLAAFVVNL